MEDATGGFLAKSKDKKKNKEKEKKNREEMILKEIKNDSTRKLIEDALKEGKSNAD